MTCTTWFSPSVLAKVGCHEDASATDLALCAQLEFGSQCPLGLDIKRLLASYLDRNSILEVLGDFARPIYLLTDLWKEGTLRCHPGHIEAEVGAYAEPKFHRPLCLSFADFPPNGIIARWIAGEIKTCTGLNVRLTPLPYTDYVGTSLSGEYCMRLNLVAPLFDDPSSIPLACKRHLDRHDVSIDRRIAFDALLSAALAAERFERRLELSTKAEVCSWEYAFSIPLLQFRSISLKKHSLSTVQVHRSGILDFSNVLGR
jgi:hypothetical protein